MPPAVKPFLKKEINLELFQDLLMDRIDPQRVSLSLEDFTRLNFTMEGHPRVMVKVLSMFTG